VTPPITEGRPAAPLAESVFELLDDELSDPEPEEPPDRFDVLNVELPVEVEVVEVSAP
jgi:hypothetical protein